MKTDKLVNNKLLIDFTEKAKQRSLLSFHSICDSCGIVYNTYKNNATCPKCGRIKTRELQPGDMEHEVN